ncbi:hypothetical protein [Nitriliruptor alkaliphilus]|uniref:hypothetical protein n=1 Tax=Nitriliruptor alkaliphilus TaxID=427918 RepID=UPI000697D979|nr:hypothetical protein [Nitriliruptor alkaliphilus]
MSGPSVPLAILTAIGVSAGGLVAWIAVAPAAPEHVEAVVDEDHDDARVSTVTGPERHHDHDHGPHDLHGDEDATTGRGHDVWLDEPPLGPLPRRPSAIIATSEAAVVGYLEAAYRITADDADIRHRRHHGWLHPDAPGRTGGIWTDDPPPDGVQRTVEFVTLELHGASDTGAAWRVVFRLWDGDDLHAERTRYVTSRLGPDDGWLVLTETVDLDPVAH